MLTIRIHNLKVISISNLGSLNIGRAIHCNNQVTTYTVDGTGNNQGKDDTAAGEGAAAQAASADSTASIAPIAPITPIAAAADT